jgi:hypothetical protein
MDLSTDYLNDPKWRRLYRQFPHLIGFAFMVYTATMCDSWKAGRRVSAEDAWPPFLPFDGEVIVALQSVAFLDKRGLVVMRTWSNWFDPASKRRAKARERWRRANAGRDADTALLPRGASADTSTTVRTVPSVPPDRPFRSFPSGQHDALPHDARARELVNPVRTR